MSITEFLLARIAERENAAQAAAEAARTAPSNDLSDHWEATVLHSEDGRPFGVIAGAPMQATRPTAFAHTVEHVALHDPARVLAECEAMRQIVMVIVAWERSRPPEMVGEFPELTRVLHHPLHALAAIWDDHVDYDEAWRA